MSRESTSENVKRKIIAESMGRCMNPDCQVDLFTGTGDIIERAHIVPYCDTTDNSYENLIILCPNCHTNFDKNHAFDISEVKMWKKYRKEELDRFFGKKYESFLELKENIQPLLLENKSIYENYYLNGEKDLWDKFECIILVNNRKIRKMLENNLSLIQSSQNKTYSNLNYVQQYLLHVEEFEVTREDREKKRHILFPKEINSLFGIEPVKGPIMPMTEALEIFIHKMLEQERYDEIVLGEENPYIFIYENGKPERIFLNDSPRLRQLYFDNNCFRGAKVRLESLNYALKFIKSRNLSFEFLHQDNLREIYVNKVHLIFVYEYCLSKELLLRMSPEEGTVIVNLHNWNGSSCISGEAYGFSKQLGVDLLTMDEFYGYIIKLRNN